MRVLSKLKLTIQVPGSITEDKNKVINFWLQSVVSRGYFGYTVNSKDSKKLDSIM